MAVRRVSFPCKQTRGKVTCIYILVGYESGLGLVALL